MKLRKLSSTLVAILCIGQIPQALAQTFHQPTSNDVFMTNVAANDPSITVTNTAALDIVPGVSSLQVVAWDGQDPSFGWNRNGTVGKTIISGSQLGTVTAPDIVLNPTDTAGSALIVYLVGSTVYYEVHKWNGSSFILDVNATPIPGTSGSTHPNVDVIRNGFAAITWSNGGSVYAKGYKITQDTLSQQTMEVSLCATNSGYTSCDRSDVAGEFYLTGQSPIFSFAFIGKKNGVERIILQRSLWWNLWQHGGANTQCGLTYFKELYEDQEQFQAPRIAHPSHHNASTFREHDLSIVTVAEHGGAQNVLVLTHYDMAHDHGVFHDEIVNTSTSADLNGCNNSSPAIAYVDDHIAVTWTYEDCTGLINGSNEVAYRKLGWDGIPVFQDYSTVNKYLTGSQRTPAVAGRYATNSTAYLSWYDADQGEIGYRQSTSGMINLKKEPESKNTDLNTLLNAFPNPINGNTVFSFEIVEGESAQSIYLFDLSGRLVDQLDLSNVGTGNIKTEWQTLKDIPNGVYMVNLVTDQRTESIRISK